MPQAAAAGNSHRFINEISLSLLLLMAFHALVQKHGNSPKVFPPAHSILYILYILYILFFPTGPL